MKNNPYESKELETFDSYLYFTACDISSKIGLHPADLWPKQVWQNMYKTSTCTKATPLYIVKGGGIILQYGSQPLVFLSALRPDVTLGDNGDMYTCSCECASVHT